MRSNIANVLDLELTCYDNQIFPEGERAEIIEFGITTVDLRTRKIIKTYSIPVIPVMSKVSPYCTQLTGWTYELLLRQGVTFEKACQRILDKYGGANRLLVVDSDRESETVRNQCKLLNAPVPFGGGELNVATLFQIAARDKRRLGLDRMLDALGLSFEGRRHRADDDSKNIARVLTTLLERTGFELKPLAATQ